MCNPCHQSCKTCEGETSNDCTSCPDSQALNGRTCVSSCDKGYYISKLQRKCLPCEENCSECNSDACTVCKDPIRYIPLENSLNCR